MPSSRVGFAKRLTHLPAARTAASLVAVAGLTACGPSGRISGTAVDRHTQGPVADVQLVLDGTNTVARTASDGRFSFTGLRPGTHRIHATTDGWNLSQSLPLMLQTDAKLDLGTIAMECTSPTCANVYGITARGAVRAVGRTPTAGLRIGPSKNQTTETNVSGAFTLDRLLPHNEYGPLRVFGTGLASVSGGFRTGGVGSSTELPPVFVFPEPGPPGVYNLTGDSPERLSESRLVFYDLTYEKPGDSSRYFAQSSAGRMTTWYLPAKDVTAVPRLMRGAHVVTWQRPDQHGGPFFDQIVPLFLHAERKIVGTLCSGRMVATLPGGWYSQTRGFEIGEFTIYCYAPIRVSDAAFVETAKHLVARTDSAALYRLDLPNGRYGITNSALTSGQFQIEQVDLVVFDIVDGPDKAPKTPE
jgi:hypothetical protein